MPSPERCKIQNASIPSEELVHDIANEVDLELALRRQLTQTLESRIAWGLLLQQSIEDGPSNGLARAELTGHTSQDVALDALLSLELPSHFILSRDPTPPYNLSNRFARPSSRKIHPSTTKPKPAFLYTRFNPAAQQDGNLYILKCPGCSKTTFSSLQGLLNHARLTHNLEWGTHDACIRACTVLDNNLHVEVGIEVGTGPSGVLPGLQTIFQMAVGGQNRRNGDTHAETLGNRPSNGDHRTKGNYLNETLGLHEDSPSLAPFLGKQSTRRQIKVCDENVDIDLENTAVPISLEGRPKKRTWKMSFAPRNSAGTLRLNSVLESDKCSIAEHVGDDKIHDDTSAKQFSPAPNVSDGLISRFRFIARIVITDRSMLIPEDQRSDEHKHFTHKWMISVDAPSYANHITSVLRSITVTSSDPKVPIYAPPPTLSPPFVVVGLSDKPFLASVELCFSSTALVETDQGQKVVFEHWVDLDPIGDRGPVVGEDQILDVELDKNTVLMPPILGYIPIDHKSHWTGVAASRPVQAIPRFQAIKHDVSPTAPSASILQRLTKRFPMVQGSRTMNHSIPYMLVASAAHFKALIVGRRKAIEMGRARAIQAAYNKEIERTQNPALSPLTVANVYSWLSEHNHFIKVFDRAQSTIKLETAEAVPKEEEDSKASQDLEERWCRICGLHPSIHFMHSHIKVETFDTDSEETKPNMAGAQHQTLSFLSSDDNCAVVPRMLHFAKLPIIDIHKSFENRKELRKHDIAYKPILASPQALVSVSDPRLILSIRRLVESLGLSRFRPLMKAADDGRCQPVYPMDELGAHRLDVEKTLAPYGLLALVTQSFVRALVERGLEAANRDKILSTGFATSKRPRGNRKVPKVPQMLTPAHILSGILTRGRGRGSSQEPLDTVVLLCLSKLGVAVDTEPLAPSRQGELDPLVKLEEL